MQGVGVKDTDAVQNLVRIIISTRHQKFYPRLQKDGLITHLNAQDKLSNWIIGELDPGSALWSRTMGLIAVVVGEMLKCPEWNANEAEGQVIYLEEK